MPLAHWLLRHPFIRFGMVGAAGYVVGSGALALSTDLFSLPAEAGLALAIFVAMCFTWTGNRYFTFPDKRAHTLPGIIREALRFMAANLLGAIINYSCALAFLHFAPLPFANKYLAQVIGVLAGMIFNFTLSRALVFRPEDPPSPT